MAGSLKKSPLEIEDAFRDQGLRGGNLQPLRIQNENLYVYFK